TSDPRQLIASVRHELRSIDPTVVIEHVKTFEQIRRESFASQTFAMWLLVGFSFVASALALVGIYGVVSLSIGSRRREIAIRMAVGGQRSSIIRSVLGSGLRLIAVGLALGVTVALGLGRILKSFLFGVESADAVTLMGMALLFAGVALLACCLPAVRASRFDSIEALRSE
ncbi:MAG: hypothetical protein JWM99_1643, partial [Verrucomicrobiales bacterium]|nr:hypothetical protein [Verrucomicrobiales bacterium]